MFQDLVLEVLCPTMGQRDFGLVEQMNLSCNAVLANQADYTEYREQQFEGFTVKRITTETSGVGRNRNLALLYASGDILLFADDDVRYHSGYVEAVLSAYCAHPEADMILFAMNITKEGKVIRQVGGRNGRLRRYRALRYGAYVFSIRRTSWERANLWFSLKYGGGTAYSHGEDTLFLLEAFRKGLHIRTSSAVLGTSSKDRSSCFHGYDQRYFYDQGVLYSDAFGRLALPMALQFCVRKRKRYRDSVSFREALRQMRVGIRDCAE